MKKANISLTNLLLGIIVLVLVIVGFNTIPTNSFWKHYDYNIDNNNLSFLDKTKDIKSLSSNISCDVVGISSDGRDCQKTTAKGSSNVMEGLINKASGALFTLYNSFGTVKTIVEFSAGVLMVPPEIVALLLSILLISILFAIIYVIFGRSDL